MTALRVGDPSDPETQVGPLVSHRQQQRVRDYIQIGQHEGAQLVTGGTEMPDGLDRGWYVQPTLFAAADNSMRIAREEIFGPVITVIPYRDEDDAVAHRQRLRLRPGRIGVDRRHRPGPGHRRAEFVPAPSGSTRATPWIRSRRSAASKAVATVANWDPKASTAI